MTPPKLKRKVRELHTLLSNDFPTSRVADDRTVEFGFQSGPILFGCYCEINPEADGFIVRAIFSPPFAPDQRVAAAEYLHRVNYDIPVGGWAIDLDSGEVRWKTGFFFGEQELTRELMFQSLNSSFFFINHHTPGLVKLTNGGTVSDALAAVGTEHGDGTMPA